MNMREAVISVLEGKKPPYVPWSLSFTIEARQKLVEHFGSKNIETVLGNHIAGVARTSFMETLENDRVRDQFGVIWDRSRDRDIGVVENCVLPEPSLDGYIFPDPADTRIFEGMPTAINKNRDRFRLFPISFSLYERAWSMRGMENLMMDFLVNPQFVHDLLTAIADHNIAMVRKAVEYDIDAVFFGDDWGQQQGLQMGSDLWHQYIYPQLARMYGAARRTGKYVFIHSCGDVDELFDDLISIGLSCFNPFQPEVMDVGTLMNAYRGRLTFNGGLSTQKTLPYGSTRDVRAECEWLLQMGAGGNYIFAPAHAVEGDVPLENMIAMIDTVQSQPGWRARNP
ncbi:MAG: uroporphyrinogen-III decarboxylase-like protein [Chitinivibrionales bacterium]|nr:uroporphyrinogen-III decarboxylase-like protein [Chitinivibrionales bacterium]MBD3395246.1 uroporphyrinogen-III decarboxylase-like protein [Chitinivibrionales bacterium]